MTAHNGVRLVLLVVHHATLGNAWVGKLSLTMVFYNLKDKSIIKAESNKRSWVYGCCNAL
ncbi:hypothetical protein CKO51_30865 [Rhodopirellula sp. SM50]|nr:hypothetical protein CKO51_30865 [Rhodopirellula sp. SM50]